MSLGSNPSKISRRVQQACRAHEPNMGLNFEIADMVNEKQGNAPREAAYNVVKLVNNSDPFVCINALTLLDVLVKNCGYPMHLQISRKEFLNELVRRFPERPPPSYNKVQRMILMQIEEWYQTIAKDLRYKKDLGFIRDMHRLLSYKGYIFPEINGSDLAVLNPSDNLKSAEDIAKEERIAQSAKLQELIRRGKPEDLKEANDLMKIMSGFREDTELDQITKQRLQEDLNKIKGKVEIFSDMVNNYNEQDSSNSGNDELLEELYTSLKVSQPTLKKIISEAESNGETDEINKLLKLNDTINLLVEKYSLIKKHDLDAASKINVNSSGEINLLDFDDDNDGNTANSSDNLSGGTAATNGGSLLDLLSDLNISSGPISLSNNGTGGSHVKSGISGLASNGSNNNSMSSASQLLSQLQNLDTLSQGPLNQGSVQLQKQAEDLLSVFGNPVYNVSSGVSSTTSENTIYQSGNIKLAYSLLGKNGNEARVQFKISNMGLKNLSNVVLLVAVSKQFTLHLQPQSSNFLFSMGTNGIIQDAIVKKGDQEPSSSFKIKWKLDYQLDGQNREESGIHQITI